MDFWRITKYDPQYRNEKGHYLKNEWTSFSDIGKSFDGDVLTKVVYEKYEKAYIDVVKMFFAINKEKYLVIKNLEKHLSGVDDLQVEKLKILKNVQNNTKVKLENLEALCKFALREVLWFKLEADSMYVHFGYDYYMYIGSEARLNSEECDYIKRLGLFIDPHRSPYE